MVLLRVQVRFNGWVTEMNDVKCMKDVSGDQSDPIACMLVGR